LARLNLSLSVAFHFLLAIIAAFLLRGVRMSIQPEDRTTMDLFSPSRPGRPRSNPYDRVQQSRYNKRSQRMRDKQSGFHRLEVKLQADVVARVDEAAEELGLARADIINEALRQWLHM
tara:strand:+ start:2303 stop:2656 length:354 start_codon:yes stop_codon:yes gene_type:complete